MDKSTGNFHTTKEKEKMINIFKGLFSSPFSSFGIRLHACEVQTTKASVWKWGVVQTRLEMKGGIGSIGTTVMSPNSAGLRNDYQGKKGHTVDNEICAKS